MNKATLPRLAALAAAGLLVGSLRLPVWHLKMEAPQYQGNEALKVRVYPGSMQGDLREISVLNKYIGVRIPEELPELRWLPVALLAGALLGLGALALPRAARPQGLFAVAGLLSLVMLASAGMAQAQMHRLGHDRNPHAALKGVPDFTPPILGRVKVANFEITTNLGSGAWLIGAGILLQLGAGMLVRRPEPVGCGAGRTRPAEVRAHSEVVA
jgi:copper chaperone NosL